MSYDELEYPVGVPLASNVDDELVSRADSVVVSVRYVGAAALDMTKSVAFVFASNGSRNHLNTLVAV